ncbi:MAG TPA: hypothetical protein PK987_01440 [Ferruginibacter sp.]|nr:hypothetical protein [Ferruginibacter sp.]
MKKTYSIVKPVKMQYTNRIATRTTVIILSVFLLIACHSNENTENKLPDEHSSTAQHQHELGTTLSLNNGIKWKADSSTNENVKNLYNVVSDANPVAPEDFQKTGNTIQANINKMISECRMQGVEHDALHKWLEPLMTMNKKLAEITSVEKGKELFGTLRKHIEKYSEFFE